MKSPCKTCQRYSTKKSILNNIQADKEPDASDIDKCVECDWFLREIFINNYKPLKDSKYEA